MKFYKVNGTWVSWDVLHNNYGYTESESTPVTYCWSWDDEWGTDGGSGYYDGDVADMMSGRFWCDADYGWFDLDGLVWNPGLYPSNAVPLTMVRNGVTSDAVSLVCAGVTYYLIRAIVDTTAWISASEAAEMGWEELSGYTLSFVNTQLPDITITMPQTETVPAGSSVTLPTMSGEYESDGVTWTPNAWDIGAFGSSYTVNDNTVAHLLFNALPEYNFIVLNNTTGAPVYRLSMDDMIIAIESSDDLEYFYFTANGANETHDTLIDDDDSNITLFDADGNPVGQMQREVYDNKPALYFEQYSGNMFAAANDDLLSDHQGNLTLIPGSGTGERKAWSLQAKKIVNVDIDVVYGDPVTIPYGYTVESVKCGMLFLNLAADVSTTSDTYHVSFGFKGENLFCDLHDASVLGFGTSPTIQIFVYTNVDNETGYFVTYRASYTDKWHGQEDGVTEKSINSDGYFVKFTKVYYSSAATPLAPNYISSALNNGYPAQFRYFDSNGSYVPYFFNVQQFLWRFRGGVFSWTGGMDNQEKTKMGYWYKHLNAPMRIHCVPNDGIDLDVIYGSAVTIPDGYAVESVKSYDAYAFGQNAGLYGSAGYLSFVVPGKGYYFNDTDTSLLVRTGNPCLQAFQFTGKNSSDEFVGRFLSSTALQTATSAFFTPIAADSVLNGMYSSSPVMMRYCGNNSGANVNQNTANTINQRANKAGSWPVQLRMFDAALSQIPFYFNVPKDIWRYQNGTFSWIGDTDETNGVYGLAFWYNYYRLYVRIHCVPSPGPKLYQVAWMNANKTDVSVYAGTSVDLKDDNGQSIPYDSTKSYILLWVEDSSGVDKTPTSTQSIQFMQLRASFGVLNFFNTTSGASIGNVAKVYYTVTG